MVSTPTILPLKIEGATVTRRGKTLVGPIDWVVENSGISIVMGPNGSGKTSFLRMLHGLERLREGNLSWAVPEPQTRTKQGFVFQTPIMMRRSVEDNLAYPLQLAKSPSAQISDQVQTWADRIGMSQLLRQPATRLSGGEKQKLALARALIREPEILFLDEPCANLDGRATREIEEILLDYSKLGTRIIMSTHNIGQAKRLASEVLFFYKGALHESAGAETFFKAPKTREAAAFLEGDIIE